MKLCEYFNCSHMAKRDLFGWIDWCWPSCKQTVIIWKIVILRWNIKSTGQYLLLLFQHLVHGCFSYYTYLADFLWDWIHFIKGLLFLSISFWFTFTGDTSDYFHLLFYKKGAIYIIYFRHCHLIQQVFLFSRLFGECLIIFLHMAKLCHLLPQVVVLCIWVECYGWINYA